MTTGNNCQGLVYTCAVDTDGFGTDQDFDKTQRARLDRLKQQYREWSERYSQRESMEVDEYIRGLDEMASMSSELDAIMKQTGPMDAFGRARSMTTQGALIYYDAESGLLNNIASAQTQYLRVGVNVAPDNPAVSAYRWESTLMAIAMMKSGGIGGPRAAIGASRIASMRSTVAAWRVRAQPAPSTARNGVAVNPVVKSLRERYLGRTPGKDSRTGNEVQDRMRAEGTLRENVDTGRTEFRASDGKWYDLSRADMAHKTDAVTWWNQTGRQYGANSPEVRTWMLNSNNYYLELNSINRSQGAILGQTTQYLPPLK